MGGLPESVAGETVAAGVGGLPRLTRKAASLEARRLLRGGWS